MPNMYLSKLPSWRLVCVLVASVLMVQKSHGQYVLASDSFSQAAGPLNAVNTGSGWAGAWQVQNGSVAVPGYNVAVATPLTYPGVTAGTGYAIGGCAYQYAGRLLDTSTGGAFSSYLTNQLIGAAGTTLLVGVLMRQDINTDDTMAVTLHAQNPPFWVSTPGVGVGHFGSASDNGSVRLWSLSVGGTVYRTTIPIVVGQATFLVLQISFGTTNTVALYVNPPAGSLPTTPDAQATTTNSIAFQSVAFYGGAGTNQASLGSVRFAADYNTLIAGNVATPRTPSIGSAVASNGSVNLTWNAVSGASQFLVYQSVNSVNQLVATIPGNSYLASGLTNGTFYTYTVVASNGTQTSAPSSPVTAVPHGPAPPAVPGLGTNLMQVNDYSREWPFVDAFKSARPWIAQQQGLSWGQGPALAVDAQGWITSLASGQYAETIMFDNGLGDNAHYPVGQYTLLYDGSGTLSFDLQSATIVSQTPGRMLINVPSGLNGIFLIESATDPANPIRNIRFILPGFEATYQTQPFHPLFLQRLGNYQVVRFMEWMKTNGSTIQNWTDRPTPGDYTYSWRGVPVEVMVQLANLLGVTAWFNVPAQATDAYVQQFATLLQHTLQPNVQFYLEYSNETWNNSFSQAAYIQNRGAQLGFGGNATLNGAQYTAYRAVQIFNIFQSVFTNPSPMIRVIASQAANSWLSDQTLQFQNAFASADVLAIAPYFNCSDTATGGFGVLGDPATASQVAAMTVDQVDSIQAAHINNCVLQQMQSSSAVAANYGLKMVAYEGGQSLVGYGGAQNNTAMTTLFKAANQGSGMQPLYAQYLQNWVASQGDMFVHYADVSGYTAYGSFGALEFQDQDLATSPKYQALTTFAAQYP